MITKKKLKRFYIPKNYLAFENDHVISKIAKPLFNNSPVKFFDHTRFFYDGSWIFFTSSSEITQLLFEIDFRILPYIQIPKRKSLFLVSRLEQFKPILSVAKEKIGIDNFLVYIFAQENFVDFFWFATISNKEDVINFYFNHIEFFKNYIDSYIKENELLIKTAEDGRIFIPNFLKSDYSNAINRIQALDYENRGHELHNKQSFLMENSKNGKKTLITQREMECLTLLLKGYTAKMIGNELNISSRTVETHLSHLKTKLSCQSRSQLIRYALEHHQDFSN